MKRYLLLRENQVSGPFTLEEMMSGNLKPMDLIWVEGESNSWKYATELKALSPYEDHQETSQPGVVAYKPTGEAPAEQHSPNVFVALPPQIQEKQPQSRLSEAASEEEIPELEIKFAQPLEEIKEMYVARLKNNQFRFPKIARPQNSLWIFGLLMGLLVSAFIIKKIIATFDEQSLQPTTASAALPAHINPVVPQPEPDPGYQTALTTEIVPVDTTLSKPVKKSTTKKVNLKKLVQVSANDYRIGVFGGIDKLKLNVNNKSDYVLDKVTIEVEYLKPNGETIRKENYFVMAVAPKSIKTMEVPPSKRGVKIKYRITNIKSHPYKASMVNV